ncbi:MAG: T9SS type A sorting domain-containing protein [Ferruginibacter sp.]
MKFTSILIFLLFLGSTTVSAQGSSCASPIILSLDAVLRNYSTSSATGANVLCTSNGTTPITWFKFTTNATGQCPLLNITASDSLAIEVGFYTSCSSLLSSSSMCFYNGYGLWAPNENFVTQPNTVYYLRVKTSTACNIKIAAQNFTPPNDDCFGALSIDTAAIRDNNACQHGGPGITPSQLCALTLENTAWYKFYVQQTGYSIITISNIHCDNGAANNNSGFQIGFFKGSCASLEWINCANGSGATVQATTASLPAGTEVFLAIDGISGSNCSYSINGFNVTGILSGTIRYFSGWKTTRSNILQWTTLRETSGHYIVELSENGIDFNPIGRVEGIVNRSNNTAYSFEDAHPLLKGYYRLKQIDNSARTGVSNIILLNRTEIAGLKIILNNPAANTLDLNMIIGTAGKYNCRITNMQGQVLKHFDKLLIRGENNFQINISDISKGQYAFTISNDIDRANKLFLKQ